MQELLLTEKDLLILSACTGELFIKDLNKIHQFVEETIGHHVNLYEFALQRTFDDCKCILEDEYLEVLNKMNRQIEETKQCQTI